MLNTWKRRSLNQKFSIVITVTTVFILIIIFAVTLTNQITIYKKQLLVDSADLAQIIADNVTVAVVFNVRDDIRHVLHTLSNNDRLLYAAVYNSSGDKLAVFDRAAERHERDIWFDDIAGELTHQFRSNELIVKRPIAHLNQRIGAFYMVVSLVELNRMIFRTAGIALLLMAVIGVLTYLLSIRFRNLFITPVVYLADLTREIARSSDYTMRIGGRREDELGVLYDGFNFMLDEIQRRERERDQALASLSISEEKYRMLVEQLPAITYTANVDDISSTSYISPQVESILGKSPSEWCADPHSFENHLHADDRERVLTIVRECQKSGGPIDIDYRIIDCKNDCKWLRDRMKLVTNKEGGRFILGIMQDITTLRNAEEQVAQFGRILEESVNEIYAFDYETWKFIIVNKGARENLGYSMDELRAMTPLRLKPRFTAAGFSELLKPLRDKTRNYIEFETVHRRKDGTEYPVDVRLQLTDLRSSRVFLAVILDISEQKRAEDVLRERERRYEILVSNLVGMVYRRLIDDHWTLTFASDQSIEITGYVPTDIVNGGELSYRQLIHPDDIERVFDKLRETLPKHRQWNAEYRIITASGDIRWIWDQGQIIYDRNGDAVEVEGIINDITDRRRMTDELNRLNQELERRVRRRTENLEAANRELKAFSYSVSHDLRAPLRAIRGFSDIITRRYQSAMDDHGRHYLANIIEAAERMERLINDLLVYSGIEARPKHFERVSLTRILRAITSGILVETNNSHPQILIPGDIPEIMGDVTMCEQIFMNLLTNAVTYRDSKKTSRVVVSWERSARHVVVCVTDNGIGIEPEFHKLIFNLFQRLVTDDEYPGTGVGLSIVIKSVRLMGGDVWVESAPGKGSRFYVKLPCADSEVSAVAS